MTGAPDTALSCRGQGRAQEHDTGAWAVKTAEADWLAADLDLACIGRFVAAALGIYAAFYRGLVCCGLRG